MRLWSVTSSATLLFFGFLTFVSGALGRAWFEMLLGVALLAHGTFEAAYWRRWRRGGKAGDLQKLGWNQLLLGVTVSSYLAIAWAQSSEERWQRLLADEPLRTVLALYPTEAQVRLLEMFPRLMQALYPTALVVVWISCIVMALIYRRGAKRASGTFEDD